MAEDRPESVPCVLTVHVSKISNLPKIGRGGLNPLTVLDILNSNGSIIIGGEREIDCKSSMSKVHRNTLSCEIRTTFSFQIDTKKVRSHCKFRCRVMDYQPFPEKPKPIGFVEVLLAEFAQRGGSIKNMRMHLLSLGDITPSGGKMFRDREELRGYTDPTQPAVIELTMEMQDPGYILQGHQTRFIAIKV
jgi:hypothetical protein